MNNERIKAIFKEQNVQLGAGALIGIAAHLEETVKTLASHANHCNVKRLKPTDFWMLGINAPKNLEETRKEKQYDHRR